jgi:hypothetical protein
MTTETIPQTLPLEPTTPIKPSEALRLGRLVRPERCSVTMFDAYHGACALGAMAVGLGFDPRQVSAEDNAYQFVADKFGWTLETSDEGDPPDGSVSAIWSRFDRAENRGNDGDAAVLAYLEGLGL